MKTFTDFVIEVSKDADLAKESMDNFANMSNVELSSWFETKGFAVSEMECEKLKKSDDIKATKVGLY